MKIKSPNWKEQELILVLDLYMKHDIKWLNSIRKDSKEIIEMSDFLRTLDIFDETTKNISNFRSPSSIHMKLMNFRALDSNYAKNGLVNVSILDKKIWSKYVSNIVKLQNDAKEIIIKNNLITENKNLIYNNEDIKQKLKECLNCISDYNRVCNFIRKSAIEIPSLYTSQKIINCMFKSLTFSSENIKELENILIELSEDNSMEANDVYL